MPRERPRIEGVSLLSARGVFGALLFSGILALILVPASLQLVAYLQGRASPAAEIEYTRGLLWADLIFQGLLFAAPAILYLTLVRPRERIADLLGLTLIRKTPLHLLWGVGIAFASLVSLVALAAGLDALGLLPDEESALTSEFERLVKQYPEFIVGIALVAALSEEVLFRGMLQPRLGILATSLLFGLVHIAYGTVIQIVGPLLLGLVFGYAYKRLGTLWVPIAAHFTFNALQLTALYFAP